MLNKSSRFVLLFLILIVAYFFFLNPSVKVSVQSALEKLDDLSTYQCRLQENASATRNGTNMDTVSVWETAVIKEPYQSVTTYYNSENNKPLSKASTEYEQNNGQNVAYYLRAESTGVWFKGLKTIDQEEPWYLKEMTLLTEKESGEQKVANTSVKVYDIAIDGEMFSRMYMTDEEKTPANLKTFDSIFGSVDGKAYVNKSDGQLVLITLDLTPNVLAMEKYIQSGKWIRTPYPEESHTKFVANIEILDINQKLQITIPQEAL